MGQTQQKLHFLAVPVMVQHLETLLFKTTDLHYDWIIILGGTNDLGYGSSAERIYHGK
jgi:hypothetical protein